MKLTTLILTSAMAAFAANVSAEEATPPPFKKADANGDKSLDTAEYAKTGAKKKFAELDTNGDGKLSKGEYSVIFDEDCE